MIPIIAVSTPHPAAKDDTFAAKDNGFAAKDGACNANERAPDAITGGVGHSFVFPDITT